MPRHSSCLAIGLGLSLLMLLTRLDHFGSSLQLPDASLAVFFAAGFYLARWTSFVGLALLAAGIDYVAITQMGVSDYCISPAYPLLLPAYFSLWFAGRWYRNQPEQLSGLLLASSLSLSLAFLISNTSFYLLSDHILTPSLSGYLEQAARYFPPYVAYGLLYFGVIAVVHLLLTRLGARSPSRL